MDDVRLRFTRSTSGNPRALGRSRGGFGSTIVGVRDAAGRLVDFVLVPGQAHEPAPSLLLLKRLPSTPASATEHVREGLADRACYAKAFRPAAREMTEQAGSLSGGQQPRLCIVRRLATRPEEILLDEPTSALDPVSMATVEDLIDNIKQHVTVALVTHNKKQAVIRRGTRTPFEG